MPAYDQCLAILVRQHQVLIENINTTYERTYYTIIVCSITEVGLEGKCFGKVLIFSKD